MIDVPNGDYISVDQFCCSKIVYTTKHEYILIFKHAYAYIYWLSSWPLGGTFNFVNTLQYVQVALIVSCRSLQSDKLLAVQNSNGIEGKV